MSCRTHAFAEVAAAASLPKTLSPANPSHLRELIALQAERHGRLRRRLRKALSAFCAASVIAFPFAAVMLVNGWSLPTAVRHFAAAANCDTARTLGLAPARRGEAGYWPWLDHDGTGIACQITQRNTNPAQMR